MDSINSSSTRVSPSSVYLPASSGFVSSLLSNYTLNTVSGLVLAVFLYLVYLTQLKPRFFSKLRHVPGPTIGHWLWGRFGEILTAEAGVLQMEWADKYGKNEKVIKAVGPFGIERLIFLSPKTLQTVLIDEWENFPRPDFVRSTLGMVTGNGLLTTEGDIHKAMKKLMSPAFSNSHLAQLVPMFYAPIVSCIELMNKEIDEAEQGDEKKTESKVIDMYPLMSRTTLDIICDTSFGYKCDSLHNPHNELAEAYETLVSLQDGINLTILLATSAIPFALRFVPFFVWYGKRFGLPGRLQTIVTLNDAMSRIRKVSEQLLDEKTKLVDKDDTKGAKDVLSVLVRTNTPDENGNVVFSREQMMDQVLTILGAGHETTASGMAWSLWLLAENIEAQNKLRAEVTERLGHIAQPSMADLNGCEYLDAVIKESLRVLPSVPMGTRKAAKDMVVDGIFIPSQTLIYLGNRVVNTRPEVWGEDAAVFKPERWADLPKHYGSINLQSFSIGAHSCIGKNMALMEMKAMLSQLILNFSYEKSTTSQTIRPTAAITMKPSDPLPLRVTKVKH